MKRFSVVAALAALSVAPLAAQGPGPGPAQMAQQADPFGRFLFPPELVMQHQGEIALTDEQRATLQAAIQDAQSTVVKMQWALTRDAEKLTGLLDTASVDEKAVLAQVDRILMIEREVKRAQMTLMVRIKNTLSPAQQARLRDVRR